MSKWLVFVSITLVIIGSFISSGTLSPCGEKDLRCSVQELWNEDFEKLKVAQALPPELFDAQDVKILTPPGKEGVWAHQLKWPGPISKEGKHRVEVLVLEWDEDGKAGVIIQTNLYNTNGNNMIWELGRTFVLGTIGSTPDPKTPITQ